MVSTVELLVASPALVALLHEAGQISFYTETIEKQEGALNEALHWLVTTVSEYMGVSALRDGGIVSMHCVWRWRCEAGRNLAARWRVEDGIFKPEHVNGQGRDSQVGSKHEGRNQEVPSQPSVKHILRETQAGQRASGRI